MCESLKLYWPHRSITSLALSLRCWVDHHQMFIRGRPEFCKDMRRQRIKGNGTSAAKAVSTYGDEKDEASPLSHRTTLGVASIIPSGQSMMHSLPSSSIVSQAAHIIPRSYPDVSSLPAVEPIGFNSGFRPGLHPNHGMPMDSNGDWVDKLERVFGPTTSQMESMFSAGDISEQLEPRPIKMPQTNPHMRHPFWFSPKRYTSLYKNRRHGILCIYRC